MTGIYKVTNKINNKCYIGQSVDIKSRFQQHESQAYNKKRNSYNFTLYRAIRKYGIKNFSFEIIEECPKEILNEREQYWINYYDSYNNGYNMTIGGDTSTNHKEKKVKQYDINGKFIAEYNSIREASRVTNIDHSLIMRCCKRKMKHAGEFLWSYSENEPIIPDKIRLSTRKVGQYDAITNKLIETYDSIKEATEAVNGKSPSNIANVCHNRQSIAYGFVWRFI